MENRIVDCFLGRALELTSGNIRLQVTLDVGPRIIFLAKDGGNNILFQDTENAVHKDVSRIYGKGKEWRIYGGHRIWLSPEEEMTYYPDNLPVTYKILPDGAHFFAPEWEKLHVLPVLTIRFTGDNTLDVIAEITSNSREALMFSIWGLTVLRPGGRLTVPLETADTGYLANRNLVFWPYSALDDKRFRIENNTLIVESDTVTARPFKVGLFHKNLMARYEIDDTVFIKRIKAAEGVYPDYSCNMETYTNNLIHEVETLSETVKLKKGQTATHIEHWEIY